MVKVLLDHNMPPSIARALNELIKADGHQAFALRDKFPQNISDVDYFGQLGRDWIVISKDLQNSRKKAERAAIMGSKTVAFYLSPALQKKNLREQAASILWHWDKILSQRTTTENGLFQIPENKSRLKAL